jgi:hypothetical protein
MIFLLKTSGKLFFHCLLLSVEPETEQSYSIRRKHLRPFPILCSSVIYTNSFIVLTRQTRKPSRGLFSPASHSTAKHSLKQGTQPSKSPRLVLLVSHIHIYAFSIDNSATVTNTKTGKHRKTMDFYLYFRNYQ